METSSELPQDIKAQLAPGPSGSTAGTVSPTVRMEYLGTPTEIIVSGLLGVLLLMVTCGLAYPWVIAGAQRYYFSRIRIHTPSGVLTPEFTGTGFLCFVEVFLSAILVGLTFGIYGPWYVANVLRYFFNNSQATDAAGNRYHPGLVVKAVDTTAAGDTFLGALAVALARGEPLDAAVREGIRASALCVTQPGAQPSIPTRADVAHSPQPPAWSPL